MDTGEGINIRTLHAWISIVENSVNHGDQLKKCRKISLTLSGAMVDFWGGMDDSKKGLVNQDHE